jgi:hypothetical protein
VGDPLVKVAGAFRNKGDHTTPPCADESSPTNACTETDATNAPATDAPATDAPATETNSNSASSTTAGVAAILKQLLSRTCKATYSVNGTAGLFQPSMHELNPYFTFK